MKKILFVIFALIIVSQIYSQPAPENKNNPKVSVLKKGSVSGVIYENKNDVPLEYSNVAVYMLPDSLLVGGGIANNSGKFQIENLSYGNYYLEAKFIGYERKIISNVKISKDMPDIDLGKIELRLATENLGEIKVVGNDKAITYQIDRKVVDPSQFPTAADGTAADILAQTPSVSVDIEGNVSLRGSQSFTVLIDGRPTPFDPADILQQIPASTIQNIEIITNPSAKYDPDGTAGIINIKTKKSKLEGISGIVNTTADSYGSLTGDFLLNYKTGKFNFFISGDRANRYSKSKDEAKSIITKDKTTTTNSKGEGDRGHSSYSLKSGFEYAPDEQNTLSFNVSLNGRQRISNSESTYLENNTVGDEISSITVEDASRKSEDLAFALNYYRTFNKQGHKLDILAYYSNGDEIEKNNYDQFNLDRSLKGGQNSWEGGDDKGFRFQADYVLPIGENSKFEAGYQARIDREDEWNDILWYTTEKPESPEADKNSQNYYETYFKRDIHSIYSIWNDKSGIFGYQIGLRTEYTNRYMDYSATTKKYVINRWDFFPTLHMSVDLPDKQQMIASYSRRINRPRGYYLEPFITYTDAYNARTGNPSIEPEFIDSYELGYQKQLGKGFFSVEGYYRVTHNLIERINSAFGDNILLRTVDNVGTDFSLGVESMMNTNLTKWWVLNLMGNLYGYRVEGEAAGKTFDTQSTNWNARLNNTFVCTPSTKLQLSGMYNSPTTTAQGRREGFAFTNIAVRQDFFDNKLAATFSVRDVLQTAKFEFTSSGVDFYSYRKHEHQAPVYSLTLSFKINNFKKEQNMKENGGGNIMDFEGEI